MATEDHRVAVDGHRIHAQVRDGAEPTLVLMHGFPDDNHLYDRLLPYLRGRRVVTFDFLGWGGSDRPHGYRASAGGQTRDLACVMSALVPGPAVLVAHDASGPPAIDWALDNPGRVHALVLLNTYYCWTPSLRRPPAIALYSTPGVRRLGRLVARRSPTADRALYFWQVGRFIRDDAARTELLPQFYDRFLTFRESFWSLNDDLLPTVLNRRRRLPDMARFNPPVRVVFGAEDRYLNPRVARWFARRFPNASLDLVDGAGHYVQVDDPAHVATAILGA